jgi:hypothetical protein
MDFRVEIQGALDRKPKFHGDQILIFFNRGDEVALCMERLFSGKLQSKDSRMLKTKKSFFFL